MVEIKDDTELGNEKQLTIKEIVLMHIKKISDLSCKEFTGGYWQKKPVKVAGGVFMSEEYHEDIREAYCNAVNFLSDIVYPWADKNLKDIITQHDSIESQEIKLKLKEKRKVFKEINIMFERFDFFKSSDVVNQ